MEKTYSEVLFMKDKIGNFQRQDGQKFKGTITGVSEYGQLQVLSERKVLQEFGLKEIKLLY